MSLLDPISSAEHLFACLHAEMIPKPPDWAVRLAYLEIEKELAARGRDCTLSNYDRETAAAISLAANYRVFPNVVITRGVFLPSPKAWHIVTKLKAKENGYECGGFLRMPFRSRKLAVWLFQFPDEAAELRQHVREAYGPLNVVRTSEL